jgi:dTDP-4-amino-4,6-dideoxygalactose transaminase
MTKSKTFNLTLHGVKPLTINPHKMIPYLDLKSINLAHQEELKTAFDSVLQSGWYIMGKHLEEFEQNYALYNQTTYSVGVANGLDALILSLKALNIGEGDEVIVPSNTYIATWLAVSYVGAIPIPVEPNWVTCNINPTLIEAKITSKTKAIIPVNLYGQAAEMDKIMAIANQYKLAVVEDNAQAQGALCNGKLAGSFGHLNATSFYPGKNLGALGDAGAITSNDESLIKQVKVLRNYGSQVKYYNEVKGVNSRLDELQAALLNVKLKYLPADTEERQRLAKIYDEKLEGIEGLTLPQNAENCTSVYHIYQIRTEKRDALQKYLTEQGIGTVIHYPVPPHLQKAYKELNYQKGDFPIAEKIANETLSIPLYQGMTEEQQMQVIEKVKAFFN